MSLTDTSGLEDGAPSKEQDVFLTKVRKREHVHVYVSGLTVYKWQSWREKIGVRSQRPLNLALFKNGLEKTMTVNIFCAFPEDHSDLSPIREVKNWEKVSL